MFPVLIEPRVINSAFQHNLEGRFICKREFPAISNVKAPHPIMDVGLFDIIPGGDLLSHTATRAVSSALRGLTSVFGMGTGVTPSA